MEDAQQMEKIRHMTTEPVEKLVCRLAVPTIISMMITAFYNMADTFFVGKISTETTAAVGVAFSIMAWIQAVGFFFGHGSGNFISRSLGAKELEKAQKMASTGFVYAFLGGGAIAALGLVFLEPLAYLLGSTPTILPYTKQYLGIILLGAPFMTSSLTLNNQLRFQGSAFYAMIGIVSGGIINVALDPLLIFGFHMGIAGAAVATAASQLVSFGLLWAGSRKDGNIGIRIRDFQPSFYYIKEIFRGGFPSLCRQGLGSVAMILLNHAAGLYGDAAIAGMSIVTRAVLCANSALIGFGQGFQPVCAMNYGAGKTERVRKAYFFCVKWAFLFLLIVAALGYVFAGEVIALFRRGDSMVIEVGTAALRMQLLSFPLGAWIVMCNMMLQSIGKAKQASIVAAGRQGIFFIPLILILPRVCGLFGVELCQALSDACAFLLSLPIGISVLKEMKNGQNG